MAFDETPTYTGPVAAGDDGSDNMLNSFYVQRGTFASLPTAGNVGVLFIATDGAAGGGGEEALYRDNGSSWDLIGEIPSSGHAHSLQSTEVSFSRTAVSGSGTQAITGAGFQPTSVIIFAVEDSTTHIHSWGFGDDAAGESCVYRTSDGGSLNTSNIVVLTGSLGLAHSMSAVLTSLDSDGCTLTWTKAGDGVDVDGIILFQR